MGSSNLSVILSFFTGFGLLLASCAQATPGPTATPAAATPTPKPAAEQPRYGGIVETASEGYPADLDGLWGTVRLAQVLVNPSYNGLIQYDPLENTKIVPRLAERWEVNPDGKVVTFYLRKGVKWHDGKPFTAQDVKTTMDLWQTPPAGKVWFGGPLKDLTEKVEVVDDYTVKISLKRRSHSYFAFLASGNIGTIAPKHILDAQKGVMKNTVVGTGPFKFKKYEAGVVYEAEKNRDYFIQGRPYLDGFRTYIIKDRSTMMAAFRVGHIKITAIAPGILTPSQAELLKKAVPGSEIITEITLYAQAWYPNHRRAPWTDKRVRQAASLAIDRQAAVAVLNEGIGTVGSQVHPTPLTMSQSELLKQPGLRQPKDQDIADAKKLLAEAGFPNGFKTSLLVRGGAKTYENQATFAKDQLAKIGIDLVLDSRDEATWQRMRRGGDFDSQVLGIMYYMLDPLGGASYFGPGNDFGFESAKRDELMAKYDSAATDAEKKAAALEFERFMMDEVPYVPFYWSPQVRVHWKEIRNLTPNSSQYNNNSFEAVYIAK